MTEPTDRAKAAEPLTALEWLRVTHADTLSGRRIEEAIVAERAAAVADLRARILALADEMDARLAATGVHLDRCIRPGDALRDVLANTLGLLRDWRQK